MAHPRFPRLLLVAADILLIAAVFVPWITVISMPAGVPITQVASPAVVLWNAAVSTTDALRLVAPSLVYLLAALEVVGLSIPLMRGALRGAGAAKFALAALPGAFICFVIGLFGAPVLYFGLTFGGPYTNATLGLGILLVFIGALLALVGLTKLAK